MAAREEQGGGRTGARVAVFGSGDANVSTGLGVLDHLLTLLARHASFDLALTGSSPGGSMDAWQQMEGATALGHVPGTAFPGTFAHIVGGYAAGYYGYMWAEVIALDMLSAFGDRLINPEVGARFRRDILSRGSEEPASVLVERFLGRPVNADAFFQEIVGART